MKSKKPIQITIQESEALLSAIYTQMEAIKKDIRVVSDDYELKQELKFLRSAERKLRKVLQLRG